MQTARDLSAPGSWLSGDVQGRVRSATGRKAVVVVVVVAANRNIVRVTLTVSVWQRDLYVKQTHLLHGSQEDILHYDHHSSHSWTAALAASDMPQDECDVLQRILTPTHSIQGARHGDEDPLHRPSRRGCTQES